MTRAPSPGSGARTLLLALWLAWIPACRPSEPATPPGPSQAQLLAVTSLDPAFASADALIWMAMAMPEMGWTDDGHTRLRFLLEAMERFRADPAEISEAFEKAKATASDLDQIVAFLASDAGRSLARALRITRAGYPFVWPDLLEQSTARWSDATKVGRSTHQELDAIRAALESGETGPSPMHLGLLVGAKALSTGHAHALAEFLTTHSGEVWNRAREHYWKFHEGAALAIRRAAIDAGVLIHPHLEDLEPLILPEAEYAVPDDTGK